MSWVQYLLGNRDNLLQMWKKNEIFAETNRFQCYRRTTATSLNPWPDFAQAKRECKRLHDEHLARTQQDFRTIPRSQQVRQRKEQQFERIEEFDYAVDPKTGWMFYKESRWNTSSWNSQHSSRSDDLWIFLRVRTSFGWLEKNIQPTDGGVKQYTHQYSTCRVAQHDHISSREHA